MTPVEDQLVRWGAQVMGWVVAGIAALLAWVVKTAVFQRLDAIEARMAILEKFAAAAVTQIDLAKSIDGLRLEIASTRMEIKRDVEQIVTLLKH